MAQLRLLFVQYFLGLEDGDDGEYSDDQQERHHEQADSSEIRCPVPERGRVAAPRRDEEVAIEATPTRTAAIPRCARKRRAAPRAPQAADRRAASASSGRQSRATRATARRRRFASRAGGRDRARRRDRE